MLRVKLIAGKYEMILEPVLRMEDALKKHNIQLVSSREELSIVDASLLQYKPQNVPARTPIVIADWMHCASIRPVVREKLLEDNCKGIIKCNVLSPPKLYNAPQCNQFYYHYYKINEVANAGETVVNPIKLPQKKLEKIRPSLPFCVSSHVQKIGGQGVGSTENRPIVLNYIAATKSLDGHHLLTWHRKRALAAAKASGYEKIVLDTSSEKRIPRPKFIAEMHKSKICLSPWGHGEHCWRDLEAIYHGAILLKPSTDFVTNDPGIYKAYKTYIPCRIDFTDLEERVDDILKNWNQYTEIRKNAYDLCTSEWNNSKRAKKFANTIFNLYGR